MFSKLGIIASMQPTHATSDMGYVESRIGSERAKDGAYIWRSLIDSGFDNKLLNNISSVLLPTSSDFPVELVDPLLGIYAAITRLDIHGKSVQFI